MRAMPSRSPRPTRAGSVRRYHGQGLCLRRTGLNADFDHVVDDYTPIVFAFVLGLSFLLLMLAFRSIVVPVKAI